jgi:predicted nucleic acid-binding protein
MRSAVDTNIISALWALQPLAEKVAALLVEARQEGGLVICGPVYAELCAHPLAKTKFVDQFLLDTNIAVDFETDEAVWKDAARALADYATRRRKLGDGQPKRLLADFIIGAHSLLHADRLLTLDPRRYKQSFPKLRLLPK